MIVWSGFGKATEIGVTEITPLVCDHSERKSIKSERINKILVRGLKQSVQYFLPKLNPLISFEEFIKSNHPQIKLLAHCQTGNRTPMHKLGNLNKEVLIMIGPEVIFPIRRLKPQ